MKNIKLKKDSIEAFNEQILDAITEEDIDDELKTSSELDLIVDTELEILTDYLKKLSLGKDENRVASISPERSLLFRRFQLEILVWCRVKLVVDTRIMSVRIKVILGRRDKNCLEASTHERGKNRVSLPKLEMKKFGGDPVVWPEFYKIF